MKLSIFYSSAQKREHYESIIGLDRHNRIDKKYISFSIVQMYINIDKLQLHSQENLLPNRHQQMRREKNHIIRSHDNGVFLCAPHAYLLAIQECAMFFHIIAIEKRENTLNDLFTGCYLTFFTKATSSFVCPNSC